MSRESRDRKPSTLYESAAFNDRAFSKVIRDYQRQKAAPVKKKDESVKQSTDSTVVSAKAVAPKQSVSKITKTAGGRGRRPGATPVMSPQAIAQHEIEERHIAACREVKQKSLRPRKVLPEGAVELDDIKAAIKRGVKETSTLLLDWSSKKAKMIGYLCKVYWDGEDTWFYARIVNYDSFYDRHYVRPSTLSQRVVVYLILYCRHRFTTWKTARQSGSTWSTRSCWWRKRWCLPA
jgi:hypothetical protein